MSPSGNDANRQIGPDKSGTATPRVQPQELFAHALLTSHHNRKRRLTSFAVSGGAQIVFLATLVGLLMVRPQVVQQMVQKEDLYFPIQPKPIQPYRPRPHVVPKAPPPQPTPPPQVAVLREVPPPQVEIKKPTVTVHKLQVTEAPKVALSQPELQFDPAPKPQAPVIKMNNLAPVNEPVTTKLPAQAVQTGGFGAPTGLRGADYSAHTNTTALGSFDMPTGAGSGNGTGGTHGATGVVAGGFADAGSGTANGQGRPSGSAHLGGFNDETQAAATPTHAAPAASNATPVEIVFKPDPQYTLEARQMHIQGEVLLDVIFEPTGKLSILDVRRGLGHGLDEQAISAAKLIRFKPATKDGSPVETPAVLHITFQIAE